MRPFISLLLVVLAVDEPLLGRVGPRLVVGYEIENLRSGTVTFAGCLVGSRKMPIWSGATAHFQVNESTVATRLHGRPPISTRKFEHSHAFCFGPTLPLDVLAAALGPANLLGLELDVEVRRVLARTVELRDRDPVIRAS